MNFYFRQKDQGTVLALLTLVVVALGIRLASADAVPLNPAARASYQFQLDINRVSWNELTLLPGIGEKLARRIVDYREIHGSFSAVEELARVKGIGPKKLAGLRNFLRTEFGPQIRTD